MGSYEMKKILLLQFRGLGDVLLTTPVIRTLRKAYPSSYLCYLLEREASGVLEGNPYIDEIIVFDRKGSARSGRLARYLNQVRMIREIRSREFDVMIDLFSTTRSALWTYLSQAPVRVGRRLRVRNFCYSVLMERGQWSGNAIDRHLQAAVSLGVVPEGRKTDLYLSREERSRARALLGKAGVEGSEPVVALFVGGAHPSRIWPLDRFRSLGVTLVRKNKLKVLALAGPQELPRLDTIMTAFDDVGPVLANLSVRELAGVLEHVDLLVSSDSGPMHMGVAVSTPTVGIFGPRDERVWFPYSSAQGHVALRKPVSCSPCSRLDCSHHLCMQSIHVQDVMAAIDYSMESRR